jgi:hypothetical protein
LADLEQQIMIQANDAAPNAAAHVAEPQPVSDGAGNSAIEKLASQFRTVGQKHVLHTRIPDWLDDALNRKILELKSNGFTRMSKEAIITDAIVRYLGVEPPAGWRLG